MRVRRVSSGVERHVRRFLVLLLVLAGLAVAGGASPAAACSCGYAPGYDPRDHADVVFSGELVEVRGLWAARSTADPERFVFEVDEVFRGEAHARQSVVTPVDGASCGLEISGPGPFVVYATEDADVGPAGEPGELHAHLCGGTEPLAAASVAELGPGGPPMPGSSPIGGGVERSDVIRLLVLASGAGAVLAGLLVWFVVRRRRRSAAAT